MDGQQYQRGGERKISTRRYLVEGGSILPRNKTQHIRV